MIAPLAALRIHAWPQAAQTAEPGMTSNELIVSVSGVRGIVGSGLTPGVAGRFAAGLATYLKGGTVVLSRDSRPSGDMLASAAAAGLLAAGCRVIDCGIAPTPTCGVAVRVNAAAGGMQVTASHNPAPWNGLKMFGPDGAVLPAAEGEKVRALFEEGRFPAATWDKVGTRQTIANPFRPHRDTVMYQLDVDKLRRCQFDVLLDANGGAGGEAGMDLLRGLGCVVRPIGCENDGDFVHEPEPVPSHLRGVARQVKESNVVAGFCLDPDSDRLALIDEDGNCLSEELTLALAVQYRLTQERGPVVVNMSSSRVVQDVCNRFGVPFYRSAVGEANVVALMRESGALIGGEGNGGVIDPRVGWVRDPFIGMGLILSLMAETNKSLSRLAAELPQYTIVKDKYDLPREKLPAAYRALKARWPEATADETDGLRLDWQASWLHVRGSNTEPVVRVIAEAPTADAARELCGAAGKMMTSV
jgi:phosphomannomutase